MKDLQIWLTYHEDLQIEQYKLHEDETLKLFKGNNINIEGKNINHLNQFYSELVTLYWVWKNNKKSARVGFCHYRRRFHELLHIKPGYCQVLEINKNCNVFRHYKTWHNYQDFYDIVDIINKQYGNDNKYTQYLLNSNTFIPYCCFIMHWEDFIKLCEFLFPVLFAFDANHYLYMNPECYTNKAIKDFRYDNISYQQRSISFLAERLISCFIICELNAVCLKDANY